MKKKENTKKTTKNVAKELPEPLSVAFASTAYGPNSLGTSSGTSARRNVAANITPTSRFSNIVQGISPYTRGTFTGKYSSNIDCSDAIRLCQMAYWNIPIFRNTVDLMTEFCVADIYFTGGNAASLAFFKAWFKKINIWNLTDQFFREYFRSGNVFMYRLKAKFDVNQKSQIIQSFGETYAAKYENIPVKYWFLNAADISVGGTAAFLGTRYFKSINDYETQIYLNPQTDYDKAIADSIPDLRKFAQERGGTMIGNTGLLLPLTIDRLAVVFYKKQDYEALAVPMGFPVLEDLDAKLELKKMDRAVARTVQQAVLLVTMGDENFPPSPQRIASMQALFQNQSVGKVLVGDWTTKVEWAIPTIGDILDPKKYEELDQDIKEGLNNILFGEDKFASAQIKLDVFLARLKHSRECFMRQFLIPEMEIVAQEMGYTNIPEPHFFDEDFQDKAVMSKIYNQLLTLGALTPAETIEAIQTNRLPTPEESVQDQKDLRTLKDQNLYVPLVGGNKADPSGGGRPNGPAGGQKKMSPIGTGLQSKASAQRQFGQEAVIKNTAFAADLYRLVESFVRKDNKIAKKAELNADQKNVIYQIAAVIMANEPVGVWANKELVKTYIKNPVGKNHHQQSIVDEIAAEHQLDYFNAAILFHSQVE